MRPKSSAAEPTDDDGNPIHIRLNVKEAGRIALLPGDPARVPRIAKELSDPRPLSSNREFTAWSGEVGTERVLVVSTGIGGPGTAIAVEELARVGVTTMVRVGTCGAVSPRLRLGDLVVADAAVRMEGTSLQYVPLGFPAAADPDVVVALRAGAEDAGLRATVGITASTDSFYAGQGRRSFGGFLPRSAETLIEDLRRANVLCFEMEAATLFTLGRVFGLRTGAILGVAADRHRDAFDHEAGVAGAVKAAVAGVRRLVRA